MVKVKKEETNLETLLLNGDDEMVKVCVEYKGKGKGHVLIKPLTMKELGNIRLRSNTDGLSVQEVCKEILKVSLHNIESKEPFSDEALDKMPLGLINILVEKVNELSGVTEQIGDDLQVF